MLDPLSRRPPLSKRASITLVTSSEENEVDDIDTARGDRPAATPPPEPWAAFSPMMLFGYRADGPVVGRQGELDAIRQELITTRSGRLTGLTLEGEPGIGKTRLLLATAELAAEAGFASIAVTTDEELRGPFLVARSILGSPAALGVARSPDASEAVIRCLEAMSGKDDPGLTSLPSDARVLRTFDLAAVAFRALAAEQALAIMIDDLQWADDDSLRLIRYVVRSVGASPILFIFTTRPAELALVTEAVNLLADLDRIGLLRHVKVHRFTPAETAELLKRVLGGPVDPRGAAVMHAQAEGVPFILEEMARAYRDGGMIQEIDGVWRLAPNADRLVPSAVRTLISRRAAHLPDDTSALLADAAVLGRHFSLKDLREVEIRVDGSDREPDDLSSSLELAVTAGLLTRQPEGSAADFSFQHEQVRDFAIGTLPPARRRAIHGAIVTLLLSGEPSPGSMPLLAHHAKAAGDAAICVRFSLQASRNALEANAPEEVLRVVELALPVASSSRERLELLEVRDDALDMLRRPGDRLEGLAEISALAEALGDSHLQLDVRLRQAAALRVGEEEDRAAVLARDVQGLASATGDREAELTACLELGQDLLRATAGEAFVPAEREVDLEGAEAAFRRAADLARELGDDAALATALRETGVILIGRVRAWFVGQVEIGAHIPIEQRVAAGEVLEEILPELPIAPMVHESHELLSGALELFEQLDDRRGAMASIIAMAYLSWAPDIHMGTGAARHIEEIRRLTSRMKAFTNVSERAAFEAQMLYGVHVFARAKVIPDLALTRGEEAYAHAQEIGDQDLGFLAAGGTAMAHVDIADAEGARRWLDRAAAIASAHPTPLRARRLETWRGLTDAVAGDVASARRHLERAAELAAEARQPAARCEALARLAVACARMGSDRMDDEMLRVAEHAARAASDLSVGLPGHPPWMAEADAALAQTALAMNENDEAAEHARAALASLRSANHEDRHLDVLIPAARSLFATEAPEWGQVQQFVSLTLAMIVQRTLDEDVRIRWLRGPTGRALTELAGPIEVLPIVGRAQSVDADTALLRSLVQGKTNREIAEELGTDEQTVSRQLGELFVQIGATSRAEATAFAFQERVL